MVPAEFLFNHEQTLWFSLEGILMLAAAIIPIVLQGGESSHSANALIVAHAKWKMDTQFSSTYELFETVADRGKDPLEAIRGKSRKATGVYFKDGQTSRYSKLYEAAPEVTEDGEDGTLVSNMSWEAVCNEVLVLHYNHKWKNFFDRARYTVRDDLSERRTIAECEMSPLSPYAGDFDYLFGKRQDRQEWTIKKVVSDRTTITRSATLKSGFRMEWDVEFWTKPRLPVIAAIHARYSMRDRPMTTAYCKLSDWVECNGLTVARTVVMSMDVRSRKSETAPLRDRSLIRVWRSKDLNARVPSRDQLFLTIPATTEVRGLRTPPPAGRERRISILGVEPRDVQRSGSILIR